MSYPTDDLNRFLDDGLPTPTNSEQRDAAAIIGRLAASPDPDPAFLKRLERRLTTAKPNGNLVPLTVVERVNSRARPWRAGVSTFSAAALLAVIVVGVLLGGWLYLPNRNSETNHQSTIAAIPTGQTLPGAALTASTVTTLGGSILYEKPTDQSTALMAFAPGLEMPIKSSVTLHGVLWYQVSVPGTSILGWAKWLQSSVPGPTPTPEAVPVINQKMKPLHSRDLVQTHGTVGVWSKPDSTMANVWTVAPGATFKVTGSIDNQFGVNWISIQDTATGQSGWIAAGFLFPLPSDNAATPGSSPADGLVPTVTPVSASIVAMTPNVVLSERPYLAEMHVGVGATVIQELRVWSQPGPDMQVVWTAEPSDHVTITGGPISFNNVDCVPIRNDATGAEGWILAYFLTPDNLPSSTHG